MPGERILSIIQIFKNLDVFFLLQKVKFNNLDYNDNLCNANVL